MLEWLFCLSRGTVRILPPAGVAQLVEQLIRNQQVIGSSPIAGSNYALNFLLHKKFLTT